MLKKLLIFFVAALCSCTMLVAQNVFSTGDPLVIYNSAAAAGSAANPSQPAPGVMAKWVKTTRMSWTTTNFKSYIWNGMAFRLRFPNNYNAANATKYPVIVFFHGGGEIGSIYDNEDQLTWGAQVFEQRITSGEWNGFMLFPQETSVGWDDSYFSRVNGVLDTLQKYNNSDPDRIISMGLSSGGYGAVAYASTYPGRVAATIASSPASVRTLSGTIGGFVHVPIWMANGGVDVNPDPSSAQGFYQDFRNAGGNIYQTYFVNDGHDTWTDMWNQKNVSGGLMTSVVWNTAHKAQPLVYYQNQQFCDTILARMGITAGYYAYQWQLNGGTIAGATGNEYTATQAGQYKARFMRTAGGSWSAWSPSAVVISNKACATDTLFAEHFNSDNYYNAEGEYKIGNFGCQNGIMTSGTDLFTQDATGVQGNRFLVDYTSAASGCTYKAGDRVWDTYSPVTVSPNTNYEYSFYTGNQNATSPAQLAPIINGTALISGSISATGTGNASWKKYTYTWNSGAFTYADLGIINRSVVTTGNDFAIDEICFKLAPASPVPGCTANTSPANGATLTSNTTAALAWTAAANAASYDVYLWTGTTLPTTPVATVTATSYSATGLTAASLYKWYVVPKNSNGITASGCSNNQTSFTTAATPVAPSCVTNTSPANGTTVATSATAELTWTAASGATSYDVYLWKGATAPTTATANVTAAAYSAAGLIAATVYNWYVVPKNAVGSAAGCSANKTSFTTATAPIVTGTGTGLQGDYYNTSTLTGPIYLTRTDATVNFNWGSASPYRTIDGNTFSVRWTGFVQPLYSQTYTFYTSSDDGVRLWVNGQEIINNWTDHSVTENSGTLTLVAGTKYSIKMEYYDNTGDATAILSWSSASTPKAVIPQKQLYLPGSGNRVVTQDGTLTDAASETALPSVAALLLKPGVYPNPVSKGRTATLQLNSVLGGPATVQVTGIAGNTVQTQQLTLAPGGNTRTIETGRLAPGIYIIHLAGSADKASPLKLIIQ